MRKALIPLLSVLAAGILIGCGNSDSGPSQDSAPSGGGNRPLGRSGAGEATAGTSGDYGAVSGGGPTGFNGRGSTATGQPTTGGGSPSRGTG